MWSLLVEQGLSVGSEFPSIINPSRVYLLTNKTIDCFVNYSGEMSDSLFPEET